MCKNKHKALQFLRFCTVGLGNTVVDFTAFFLLTLGGVPYLLAQILSYSSGVANSFFLNRKWTFRVARKASIPEVVKFIIVNGLSLLISSGLLFILHDVTHLQLWLSKFAATGCGIVVNFTGSRFWVFTENPGKGGENQVTDALKEACHDHSILSLPFAGRGYHD
ncbi:MAG TPA: GtrA family protein [Desulfotomaculum sp.]|nr:GtrA family protein [Desulfotomaculum sp.]